MKNWSRIKEAYNGGFTEMYLDLYKCESGFVIKGSSYHYNAGAENVLCEVRIPTAIRGAKDILRFIADNHLSYPWAKITLNELHTNDQLITFIEENI